MESCTYNEYVGPNEQGKPIFQAEWDARSSVGTEVRI